MGFVHTRTLLLTGRWRSRPSSGSLHEGGESCSLNSTGLASPVTCACLDLPVPTQLPLEVQSTSGSSSLWGPGEGGLGLHLWKRVQDPEKPSPAWQSRPPTACSQLVSEPHFLRFPVPPPLPQPTSRISRQPELRAPCVLLFL